ncbi:MAG TPA: hypothetical protein VNK06_04420 [Thermodesulfobacteriota bacterium]|nr:hypothetical protein [Thermodesulfobacteriota bacterium]
MKVLLVILSVFFAAPALAGGCKQEAILHDSEYYMSEYCWTEGTASKYKISVWDSTAMIRVIARLVPGSAAKIVGKSEGFYKIKVKRSDGNVVYGWISDLQIERIIARDDDSEECDY